MTTHELARLLLDGPDVTVYVDGYEGGLCDLTAAQIVHGEVERDARLPGYFGPHGGLYERFEAEGIGHVSPGCVLSRETS